MLTCNALVEPLQSMCEKTISGRRLNTYDNIACHVVFDLADAVIASNLGGARHRSKIYGQQTFATSARPGSNMVG
jgi:hypothetical protein